MAKKQQKSKVVKRGPSQVLLQTGICLAIAAVTIAVYWQVRAHDFVHFDDYTYIVTNPHVNHGLSAESLRWAFNIGYAANWHPLTWISHMVDVQFFGLDAGKHHLVGLVTHILSAILLFLALARMTGSNWQSAFVAVLFAIHPLHVESVAWAAERKDVLSTFFMMLTLLSYAWYVERPKTGRYLLTLLMFALGLLAKPMLVTMPFVLLLLDYWPLRRRLLAWKSLILEKIPFLFLAIGSSILTVLAQSSAGAVQGIEKYSIPLRIENAALTYVIYLWKTIWPAKLGIPYPHPGSHLPLWQGIVAAVLLAGLSALFLRSGKLRPYLSVGWLWYLGTLIPVIGLVQVGGQAMADRYTYVPLIGIFVIVAWAVPDMLDSLSARRYVAVPAVLAILALSVTAYYQVSYWQDTVTIFKHTIAVTDNNAGALNNLGATLLEQGHLEEAFTYLTQATQADPKYSQGWMNLGNVLTAQGKYPEAISAYQESLTLDDNNADTHSNMGRALAFAGRPDEAVAHCEKAIRLVPGNSGHHDNYGIALAGLHRYGEALREFDTAIQLEPTAPEPYNDAGYSLILQNKFAEAIPYFERAVARKPMFPSAQEHLTAAYYEQGEYQKAWNQVQECERLGVPLAPELVQALRNKLSSPTGVR